MCSAGSGEPVDEALMLFDRVRDINKAAKEIRQIKRNKLQVDGNYKLFLIE